MDVLATPDVLSHLEITKTSVNGKSVSQVCSLFAFSKYFIAVIFSDKPVETDRCETLDIQTKDGILQCGITFDNLVQTESNHWIAKYSCEQINGDDELLAKWNSLLEITHCRQMRKEERMPINSTTIRALSLKDAEAKIWTLNEQRGCVIHDLSFSGARFLCTEDIAINSDQKTVLQLSFINPSEIATIRSVILRSRIIQIAGIDCLDVAVRFLEPVDLVYLSRMTACYQRLSGSFSFT